MSDFHITTVACFTQRVSHDMPQLFTSYLPPNRWQGRCLLPLPHSHALLHQQSLLLAINTSFQPIQDSDDSWLSSNRSLQISTRFPKNAVAVTQRCYCYYWVCVFIGYLVYYYSSASDSFTSSESSLQLWGFQVRSFAVQIRELRLQWSDSEGNTDRLNHSH